MTSDVEEKGSNTESMASDGLNGLDATTSSNANLASALPDHQQHVEGNAEALSETKQKTSSKAKQPVIHYSTLLVKYHAPLLSPSSSEASDVCRTVQASLKLIERDDGDANDFYNISLDLIVQPRNSTDVITIPVDDILTLRHISTPDPPCVRLHARGAMPLGTLAFPNGPEACQAFILSLQNHATFRVLTDPHVPGTLYAVEAKSRMRRIAPSLMPLWFPQPGDSPTGQNNIANRQLNDGDDDAFNELLSDLNISSATATRQSRAMHRGRGGYRGRPPRPVVRATQLPGHNVTMAVLSHFARITQAARDVGGQLTGLVDEERRKATAAQDSAAQAAREAALDIHASVVTSTNDERELPPRFNFEGERGRAVSSAAWRAGLNEEGCLEDARVIRHAIFAGGVDPSLRPTVWPFLLGLFPWSSSAGERTTILQQTRAEYASLKRRTEKAQSRAITAESKLNSNVGDNDTSAGSTEQKLSDADTFTLRVRDQIAKDIVRTDRSLEIFRDDDAPAVELMGIILNIYAHFNPEIAYCQGMSDFLAPIIQVIGSEDEALPFWCFQRLMQRMEANFRIDQSGMHAQLAMLKRVVSVADAELAAFFEDTDPQYYTCFRWIVVRFKRELPFDDVVDFWEILWSRQVAGDDLHIFVAAALLLAHRRNLLALRRGAFDSLLRYINDMSMRIDVDFAVQEGELCFRQHGDALLR